MNYRSLLIASLILTVSSSIAQDRQFVRTYQSSTLAKGVKDLEVWNTYRTGRQYFYNRLDQRLEFEIGLTDKLQTALYLNAEHKTFASHLDTLGGIKDTSSSGVFSESGFSVSSEWKFKISDAVANTIGSALYLEFTVGTSEVEIEGKIILDKRTDKNIFAFNIVGEYEMGFDVKKGETQIEKEMKAELDLAYMRMLNPYLGLGLEIRNHNVFVKDKLEHSALFGGPTLFYSGDKFFIILNALPQWTNLQVNEHNPNSLNLNEYQKIEARLLIGFNF
ncbi:MAG: hypothetical protein H0W84_10755 [Bacteroidetes bacterium]|nr:hypothetical protein [Bacteroidota bacterium]